MNHIFISYSHKDTKYVEKLERKLKAEGFDVWVDHRIDYGSRWTKEIENAIDTCGAYIVIMSENSAESQWVQREVIHAEKRHKPFFPLLLSGEAWFSLGNIQFVNVTGSKLPPKDFYEDLATAAARKTPPAPKQRTWREIPPRLWWVAGSILILGLLLLGGYLSNKGRDAATPPDDIDSAIETFAVPLITDIPSEDLPATPATDAQAGDTWTRPTDGMVMSYIPAGEFRMGSEDGDDDERPVHTVYLDAFWMDQTEVTNAMYLACVETGRCEEPSDRTYLDNPTYANHPVVYVSWEDANNYCEKVGGRLPTEAEWEKAARGGLEGNKYPWGDEDPVCELGATNGAKFDDSQNCNASGTEAVGSFSTNDYGLYDMAGNVWEWTSDWYDSGHYWYSRTNNPSGPSSGELRVLRGGSWDVNSGNLRSANRNWFNPDRSNVNVGFRCARSASE